MSKDTLFFRKAKLVLRTLPLLYDEKEFALHGGTAINFFVRDMPRLSVDIDLIFLPVTDLQTAEGRISAMLSRLSDRLQSHQMGGRSIDVKTGGDPEALRVITIREGDAVIKVEPNFFLRGSIFPPEQRGLCRAAQTALELDVEANVLSVPELYGGKICAAFDRQHPRDLFDIKLLLDHEGITDEIRKCFIVHLISHHRFMADLLDPSFIDLEDLYRSEFRGMTEGVLLEDLEKTRQIMLGTIRKGMTDKEREFILSIKKGSPDWDLIELEGVDRLPGVNARLNRISKMDNKKRKEAIKKLEECLKL